MTAGTATHDVIALRPRAVAALVVASAAGIMMFLWPLLASPDSALTQDTVAPLLFAAILPLVIGVVLGEIGDGGIDVKAIAMLGVLTAVGAAVRPLGAGAAGFEAVFFVIILGGRVFGPGFGFTLGTTVLFASALLTGGVGPWLPFQMLAAGWVGLGAGLLPRVRGAAEVVLLVAYGVIAALCYGVVMNLSFWPFAIGAGTELSYVPGAPVTENLHRLLLFSAATSLGWDLGRAAFTGILLALTAPALLGALRRAARRAAFGATAGFSPAPARNATPAPAAGTQAIRQHPTPDGESGT